MKVKNVMFSGFAAAVFATVCGAAVAADVQLISKDYADTNLQAKLTPGQGIDIETTEEGTTISADVDLSTLATKDSVETLAGKVGDETKGLVKAVADLETNKANTTSVYSKTEADERFMVMNDSNALGANLQWTSEGKLDTKGIATADGLDKLDERVNGSAQTEGSVAYDIAAALTSAKGYTDAEVKELAEGQVATNTANIELKANSADVYTKSQVDTELGKKQNELTAANVVSGSENVTVGFENGVYTISATDNNTEYGVGTPTTEGLTKLYTATGEAQDGTMTQAAIKVALEGKLATDGTAAKATADANGLNIAETYATKEAVAGKLSSIKTAGSYLVNFGTDGNVSYAPIQILGSDGQPITLTGENAVAPSAN